MKLTEKEFKKAIQTCDTKAQADIQCTLIFGIGFIDIYKRFIRRFEYSLDDEIYITSNLQTLMMIFDSIKHKYIARNIHNLSMEYTTDYGGYSTASITYYAPAGFENLYDSNFDINV